MCPVCSAPAFSLDGACVFCHAPLAEHGGEAELLEYLSERIPTAHVKRGAWNRGPITEAAFDVSGRTFRARWKDQELDLEPPVDLVHVALGDPVGDDPVELLGVLRPRLVCGEPRVGKELVAADEPDHRLRRRRRRARRAVVGYR